MTTVADFDRWSDFYQCWSDIAAAAATGGDRDVAFLRDLAESAGGPVADLGVGTGRVAVAVQPDVGVDISADMIAAARRHLDATELLHADLAEVVLPRPAALQYCMQNTLNHVADGRQEDVFRAAWANATPGGQLVVEVALVVPERLRARDRVPVLRATDDTHAVYDVTRMRDGRRSELIGILDVSDLRGVVVERRYFPPIAFTFLTVEEVLGWATAAGWRTRRTMGDFDGSPLEPGASSGIFVFQRPA